MRSGWVINVVDLITNNRAFKMFFASKETVNKYSESLKIKYDTAIKDRFKVAIHTPYSEIGLTTNISFKHVKNIVKEELLNKLSNVDPILVGEDENYYIIEIKKQNLPKLFEVLKEDEFELNLVTNRTN